MNGTGQSTIRQSQAEGTRPRHYDDETCLLILTQRTLPASAVAALRCSIPRLIPRQPLLEVARAAEDHQLGHGGALVHINLVGSRKGVARDALATERRPAAIRVGAPRLQRSLLGGCRLGSRRLGGGRAHVRKPRAWEADSRAVHLLQKQPGSRRGVPQRMVSRSPRTASGQARRACAHTTPQYVNTLVSTQSALHNTPQTWRA